MNVRPHGGSPLYLSFVHRQTPSVKVEAEAFEFDYFIGQAYVKVCAYGLAIRIPPNPSKYP